MLEELLELCYSNNRIVPKRTSDWLKANHFNVWEKVNKSFPDTSLKDIINYLRNGINNLEEIPGCSVCGNPVHLRREKLLTECSVACAQKSSAVKNKIDKTCKEKYGASRYFGRKKAFDLGDHYSQKEFKNLDDINDKNIMNDLSNSSWKDVAEHFGFTKNSHSTSYKFMKKYGYDIKTLSGKSNLELEIVEYIKSLGFNGKSTKSVISPYELDIYIPEKKLAIEFDGLYWHSSNSRETDKEKSKYHLMKTEMCESKGIQLLHIFENEWTDDKKKEIWKSVIKHKLGISEKIPARKCEIKHISPKDISWFIEENHLQGNCNGAKKAICLFYENELVQVVTLGKPRYSKGYDWELLRMCTKKGYVVQGGSSKLLSGIHNVISYANRRWSYGNVYEQIGFKLISVSSPCYWYIDRKNIYHRSSYMKHKLNYKLDVFDDKISEVENCYANGLRRIWDCGNLIYCKE